MRLILLATLFLLTACILPGNRPGAAPAVNPITGAEVTVQSLDAPAAQPASPSMPQKATPTKKPMTQEVAAPLPAPGLVDASQDAIEAAEAATRPTVEKPAATDEAAKSKSEAPAEAIAETPEDAIEQPAAAPQSPEEALCRKKGGVWATAGKSGAKACVKRTKDAGKSCTRQTQCEGYCLARSGTCAPITPMFGCNEILQADGREVTLCLD